MLFYLFFCCMYVGSSSKQTLKYAQQTPEEARLPFKRYQMSGSGKALLRQSDYAERNVNANSPAKARTHTCGGLLNCQSRR